MKLSLGCDHGAYALKEHLKDYLTGQGHEVVDCGTYSTDRCDYPILARAAGPVRVPVFRQAGRPGRGLRPV